jgi:Na+-translocating ferredoxin:NAD+ oxidoreductase subunit G
MSHDLRHIITSALLLALFGVAGAGLVALVFDNTEERIEANIRAQLLKSLNEIMPPERYDNDIVNDTLEVWNADLNPGKATTIYRARKNGKPVAAIFNITAPGGYGGPIRLLVGINRDGSLAGVRVVEHHETPGLGDKIEPAKSNWLLGFVGKSLDNPKVQNWKVKRDGGAFDQFTGATITPRAVVKGIKNTLLYFSDNSDAVFETLKPKEKQANE